MPSPVREETFSAWQFWRLTLISWTIFAVLGCVMRVIIQETPERAVVLTLLQSPISVAFSGVLWVIYRRPALAGPFRLGTASWTVGLSLVSAVAQTTMAEWVAAQLGWGLPSWMSSEGWFLRIFFFWLAFLVWSLAYFGIRARQSAQRMELRLLRSQLDPHFLFNSLNNVAAEVKPHPEAALEMVRDLADYLRYSLEHRDRVVTTCGAEIDVMKEFLKIEQARFGGKLKTTVDASPAARLCKVPSFLLQPLVENAVKHGFKGCEPPWEISITAAIRDSMLKIEVTNSGNLVVKTGNAMSGFGLETLRRRLELHYPDRHEFTLVGKDGVVHSTLELEGEPCFA